jgi:hypothetical protein
MREQISKYNAKNPDHVRHPSILREGMGMGKKGQCEALKKNLFYFP